MRIVWLAVVIDSWLAYCLESLLLYFMFAKLAGECLFSLAQVILRLYIGIDSHTLYFSL